MSDRTTRLGPRVSLTTTPSQPDSVMFFEIPSATTVDVDGRLDAADGTFLPRTSSATVAGPNISTGELALLDTSDATAKLAIRVGDVVWQFESATSVDVS